MHTNFHPLDQVQRQPVDQEDLAMPHVKQVSEPIEEAKEEPKEEINFPPSLQLDNHAFIQKLAAFHKERGYVAQT